MVFQSAGKQAFQYSLQLLGRAKNDDLRIEFVGHVCSGIRNSTVYHKIFLSQIVFLRVFKNIVGF